MSGTTYRARTPRRDGRKRRIRPGLRCACWIERSTTAGSYQAAVTPSSAFNYGMEIIAFEGASSAPAPVPGTVSDPHRCRWRSRRRLCRAGTVGTAYSATLAATGRSFAVQLVGERFAERPLHERRRNDQRHAHRRRNTERGGDHTRFHRHDRVRFAARGHRQFFVTCVTWPARDYLQSAAFWQCGIWGRRHERLSDRAHLHGGKRGGIGDSGRQLQHLPGHFPGQLLCDCGRERDRFGERRIWGECRDAQYQCRECHDRGRGICDLGLSDAAGPRRLGHR